MDRLVRSLELYGLSAPSGDERNVERTEQPSPKGPPFALASHYLSLQSLSLGLWILHMHGMRKTAPIWHKRS